MISIISLIYKSKTYADSVWESAWANTRELQTGDAEFLFIANNATDEVLDHLKKEKYPHVDFKQSPVSPDDFIEAGYDHPL